MITFFRSPFFLPWLYPGLTWKLPTVDKKIYLTFDDGPVPGPTEFVLDELKRVGAGVIFFLYRRQRAQTF
jgi:peptidoglycan/xylan/chitin deacetylase (PgdA/CDA1 family)